MRLLLTFLLLLGSLPAGGAEPPARLGPVPCEGSYPQHLQGVCTDERDAIYWCFTTRLVKTNVSGQVVKQIDVQSHHGDLCFHDGKVFVAVNFGKFNDAAGNADSWVYVYDADSLALLAKHKTPELIFGAGGIAQQAGKFIVVGGLPEGTQENTVYEYDANFNFIKQHLLKTGPTLKGIQTAAFSGGHWYFGCYGNPAILLTADESFAQKGQRYEFNCSLGIVPLKDGTFLIARGTSSKEKGYTGRLVLAKPDDTAGLKLLE